MLLALWTEEWKKKTVEPDWKFGEERLKDDGEMSVPNVKVDISRDNVAHVFCKLFADIAHAVVLVIRSDLSVAV